MVHNNSNNNDSILYNFALIDRQIKTRAFTYTSSSEPACDDTILCKLFTYFKFNRPFPPACNYNIDVLFFKALH